MPVVQVSVLSFQMKIYFGDVKEKYLREYCFSGAYILSLLLSGYHFTADSWKNIHFMGKVIWTLVGLGEGWMVVTGAALGLKVARVNLT